MSEKLQREIIEWEKQFSDLPVRWLVGKNLHITLVPPWYEENLEKIEKLLKQVKSSGSIDLKFERVTFGPDPRRPRLIWAEGEVPPKLLALQQKLQEILEKEPENGFDRLTTKRPLTLHLTLARFRPESFSSFEIQELKERIDWREEASRVALFNSMLSREGANYQIIRSVPI